MYRYAVSFPNTQAVDPDWRKSIARAAIRRIEYSCGRFAPEAFKPEVAVLREMQARGEVEVASIHIPFGDAWAIANPDEAARRLAVSMTREFVDVTRPLGTVNYTLHGSAEPIAEDARRAYMASLKKSLAELAPVAEDAGISLNLENLPRTCLRRCPEEMLEMLAGLPEKTFGYCLDVNHFCGFAERCPEIAALLGKRIRACHFSDYDGIDECHWYPGLGVLDWQGILDVIRTLPQDIVLIFETFGFLKAPHDRAVTNAIRLRDAEKCVYWIEHAAELEKAVTAFDAGRVFGV